MMDQESIVYEREFKASENEELLSAMAALSKLHEKQEKVPAKPKRPARKKKNRKNKTGFADIVEDFIYDWSKCVCGMNHPPVPFFKDPDGKRCTYYWQVADMFPYMTIHRVLTTEIKFVEADKDQSGVIEINEMAELLGGVMQEEADEKMVNTIFKQIDKDGSGTLDFTEVLSVIDSVIQRKIVNLPNQVKNEVSKTCVIQ